MSDDQDGCMGECFFWYQPTRVVLDKGSYSLCNLDISFALIGTEVTLMHSLLT